MGYAKYFLLVGNLHRKDFAWGRKISPMYLGKLVSLGVCYVNHEFPGM